MSRHGDMRRLEKWILYLRKKPVKGYSLGQIYAPLSQEIWRVPKKIIYRDTIEIEKGHQNSHQHESLIAHKLFLGEGSLR